MVELAVKEIGDIWPRLIKTDSAAIKNKLLQFYYQNRIKVTSLLSGHLSKSRKLLPLLTLNLTNMHFNNKVILPDSGDA